MNNGWYKMLISKRATKLQSKKPSYTKREKSESGGTICYKVCNKCNNTLPLDDFGNDKKHM